jgi:hypothetical protein
MASCELRRNKAIKLPVSNKSSLTSPDFFIRESSLHPGVTHDIGCIRGMNEKDTHYENGV